MRSLALVMFLSSMAAAQSEWRSDIVNAFQDAKRLDKPILLFVLDDY